jgi:2-polyprenyl-6-hydroxyphenyl methylase/3-demethylubiquinone-9 3-methyltransferase
MEPTPAWAPSVDPREVAYYQGLADRWWDGRGPFWPLHRLNAVRSGYIRDVACRLLGLDPLAPRPLAGVRALDIGCGGGLLSEALSRLGADVHGIDVTPKNVTVAALHASAAGLPIRYEVTSVEDLARASRQYDLVLNMEVVEHVPDLTAFMADCCRLVRPGGVIFVATINRTLVSWVVAIVGAEYLLRWLPRGTHRWGRFRTPREVEDSLRAGGLAVTDRSGVRVNPLTRHFALTRYLGVNYMLAGVKAGGG